MDQPCAPADRGQHLGERRHCRAVGSAKVSYAKRRKALTDALAEHGIAAYGSTGLGVWVPLAEEATVVQQLLERGWAVSPGERYRFGSPPSMRVTTTSLEPDEAAGLAAAIAEILHGATTTYSG